MLAGTHTRSNCCSVLQAPALWASALQGQQVQQSEGWDLAGPAEKELEGEGVDQGSTFKNTPLPQTALGYSGKWQRESVGI